MIAVFCLFFVLVNTLRKDRGLSSGTGQNKQMLLMALSQTAAQKGPELPAGPWPQAIFLDGCRGKEAGCQSRKYKRFGFDPGVRKIPWRRACKPILVFLPGESHGERGLMGYSPYSHKELDTTEVTQHTSKHAQIISCISLTFLQ